MVRLGPRTLFSFFLLTFLLLVSETYSDDQVEFFLYNKCKYRVWPASLTTNGNRNLPFDRFGLKMGDKSTVMAPAAWNGHFWGRTLCKTDSATKNFSCVTGDCGTGKVECDIKKGVSRATRAEFRLGKNGLDFYSVNVVEGFNIPIAVTPMGASGVNLNCSSAGCPTNLNTLCPTELKVMENEDVVACQGACSTDNLQNFCCLKNNFSTTETCDPSSYTLTLKTACPHAYSYPYNNGENTFSCSSKLYKILFCPASMEDSTGSFDEGVSVGDSLAAGNGTTRWLSPSGDFAFGFYQLPNEFFLLAIWYAKVQNDAIIWFANGDNPVPKGSTLVLNDSHGLMLINPQGLELWRSSYFSLGRISRGLMKDDGNFLLQDQNYVVLWQSFSHFSDTLVPGQELNSNKYLYSRQGEFNFSRGKFELHLQENGDVLLNLIYLHTDANYSTQSDAYYDSGIVDPENESPNVGKKFIFDKSGLFLYILKNDGTKFKIITNPNETISNNGFYYKATINYDGVFTLSYYPKDQKKGQRWFVAKTIPENICLNSTFNNGQSICGLNSICNLRDDRRPMCNCLDGYSLIDSNNMYGGCMSNSQVICQGRHHQSSQNDTFVMTKLSNTYWPKSDYETLSPCSLEECKESCLQDCLCVLVFFNESSCWKKKLPLSHGRKDVLVKGISTIKMKKNDTLSSLDNKTKKKKGHDTLNIVISILLGISVVIIVGLVCTIFFGHNHKKIKSRATKRSVVDKNLRIFTFKEIIEITKNFRDELGRGSCSIVYKGTIDMDTSVAIKKLDKLFQDSDKEFQTEMNVIIQTHHRNLVRLHGYCSEEQHRILVYELMSNGTLASFLFTPLKPSWNQRVQIANGIARGLFYLHEECCTQIIHCDIKPQNILLDDEYNAKISDFGLAKLLLINQSHTKTGIRGTKGYVAPDWFRNAPISAKVDTYSFGVLLLEIICCRKNVENDNVSEEKRILTDWAYDSYKANNLYLLLENECEVVNDMSRVEKFVKIAIWCTQEDPSLRPTMKKVLLMLEEIVEVAIPPSPYLYGSFS